MAPSESRGRSARRAMNGAVMLRAHPRPCAQDLEHPRGHLVDPDPGGVHGQVRLTIEGHARAVERLRLLAAFAGEHRAVAAPKGALVEQIEATREPDHG